MDLRIIQAGMLLLVLVSGCQGMTSREPPMHWNQNMDTQIKYKPFRKSDFFANQMDMRPLVKGVVPRGYLNNDDHFYRGMVNKKAAKNLPEQIIVNRKLLERGRERFNIYCAPCHSQVGNGEGMVASRLPIKPTTFFSSYMYKQPIGHYVDVMYQGIRTMPSYSYQVNASDRWAIAVYIRALQLSQNPDLNQLAVISK